MKPYPRLNNETLIRGSAIHTYAIVQLHAKISLHATRSTCMYGHDHKSQDLIPVLKAVLAVVKIASGRWFVLAVAS